MRIFYSFALILVFNLLATAQRGILLEQYTSAWCGQCPDAHLTIEELKAIYPSLIPVMHHSSVDGMGNPFSTAWRENFNISGTPQGVIDRKGNHAFDLAVLPSLWESRIQQRLAEFSKVDIALHGTYEPTERRLEINVQATFSEVPEAQELRLNVMILEDSVTGGGPGWFQSNYFDDDPGHPLEGLGNPIYQYPHRYVLREILDGDWGTSGVIPSDPAMGTPYSHTYEYVIPDHFDAEQVQIIAFVSHFHPNNPAEREVLNARAISINALDILSSNAEVSLTSKWLFFPNPTNDYLQFKVNPLHPGATYQIELFNSAGVLLQRHLGALSGGRLDLHHYPAGVYLITVQSDEEAFSHRFLIQR